MDHIHFLHERKRLKVTPCLTVIQRTCAEHVCYNVGKFNSVAKWLQMKNTHTTPKRNLINLPVNINILNLFLNLVKSIWKPTANILNGERLNTPMIRNKTRIFYRCPCSGLLYELNHIKNVALCFWLLSLSTMFSRFVHVVAVSSHHSLVWPNNIPYMDL